MDLNNISMSDLKEKLLAIADKKTLIKFGIGRATYDASQEIRNGHITREEGIALIRRYDQEFPKKYFAEFLDYLGMDEEAFFTIADKFRSPHLWKKGNDGWVG